MLSKLFITIALAFTFVHSAPLLKETEPILYQTLVSSNEFVSHFSESGFNDFGAYTTDAAKKFWNWLTKINDVSSSEYKALVAAQNGNTNISSDLKELLKIYYKILYNKNSASNDAQLSLLEEFDFVDTSESVSSNLQTDSSQRISTADSDNFNTEIFNDLESTVKQFSKTVPIEIVTAKPLTKEDEAAAANAHYTFAYDVDNNIQGYSQQHVETRKNGKVYGKYSFDDGNNFITRYYIADKNGFRIVKETVDPSQKAGRSLNGQITVHMASDDTNTVYTVTQEDIEKCRVRPL